METDEQLGMKVIYAGAIDSQKPKLLLLLEAIQQNPSPPYQKYVRLSEYQANIALRALECVPELKALFQVKSL